MSRHRKLLQGNSTKQTLIHSVTIYPSPGAWQVQRVSVSLAPGEASLSWLLRDSPHSHHPASRGHQMGPFF